MTAEMHLALASAFGVERSSLRQHLWPELLGELEDGLHGCSAPPVPATRPWSASVRCGIRDQPSGSTAITTSVR